MIKFLKQPMMRKVLIALAPIYLFSLWMYGLRVLAAALVVFVCGFGTEWLFERKRQGKVSEAVLVTCALYTLAWPPATPLWILAVGIIFAVAMAKGVYADSDAIFSIRPSRGAPLCTSASRSCFRGPIPVSAIFE